MYDENGPAPFLLAAHHNGTPAVRDLCRAALRQWMDEEEDADARRVQRRILLADVKHRMTE